MFGKMARMAVVTVGMSGILALGGCGVGDAMTGIGIGKNVVSKNSHLKVQLDGQQAKQNTLKKAATGHSNWTIKNQVNESPKLKYELENPDKFGRITMVAVSIFQEFGADFSHQAEYTIVARDGNNPQAQMKPDTEYDLGNPGSGFKVLDLTGKEVPGVKLTPGKKYSLQLTVKADHSETAAIEFKTK